LSFSRLRSVPSNHKCSVSLTRNPLSDIAATRAIDPVILRGTVHDRAALDTMLADTKARVAAWDAAAKP
jgi:hypothetical protein